MSVINEILPFAAEAQESLGEVLSLSAYQADTQRLRGNQPGIARLELVNTVLRQVSHVSAGTAQFIANRYASGVKDDGDLDAFEEAFKQAILAVISDIATPLEEKINALDALRKAQIGRLAYFTRATLPEGFVPANGDLVLFEDWPELEEAYNGGAFDGMLLAYNASSEDISAWRGKYRLNAANPTGLYVPDLEGLFLRNGGSNGKYNVAGMPNASGYADGYTWWKSSHGVIELSNASSDAPTINSGAIGYHSFSIDLSRQSDIFGMSNTVMPESVDTLCSIYLGRPAEV